MWFGTIDLLSLSSQPRTYTDPLLDLSHLPEMLIIRIQSAFLDRFWVTATSSNKSHSVELSVSENGLMA